MSLWGNVDSTTIIADLAVPSKNSVNNNLMSEVIGNKTDDSAGDSEYSKLYRLDKQAHGPVGIYPALGASVSLSKGAGAWAAYPTPTEIAPASTITSPFNVIGVSVVSIAAAGEYAIKIYRGGAGAEVAVGEFPVIRSATVSVEGTYWVSTGILPANTRVSCAISGSPAGAGAVCAVKLLYQTY